MTRGVRIGLGSVVLLVVLVVGSVGAIYGVTESRFGREFDVEVGEVPIPTDSATVEWGRHLALTRGCTDCHGEDFGGVRFVDVAPVASLAGSNLTTGDGGVGGSYTDEDWVRAIRHGIRPDGTPLLFMPSYEYNPLSDEDLGAMIAFLRGLPPVDRVHEPNRVGPVGRVLYLRGTLPLVPAEMIDHAPREFEAPPRGPTAEYGEYIAHGCTGCHGTDLTGGPIPGGPPEWPPATDVSGGAGSAIEGWTFDDFDAAVREGVRPDGSVLDAAMPWRNLRMLTEEEVRALWLHLSGEDLPGD